MNQNGYGLFVVVVGWLVGFGLVWFGLVVSVFVCVFVFVFVFVFVCVCVCCVMFNSSKVLSV